MRLPLSDTDVAWCRWCQRYHAVSDCFAGRISSAVEFIFEHWFEWYLKAAVAIVIAFFIYAMVLQAWFPAPKSPIVVDSPAAPAEPSPKDQLIQKLGFQPPLADPAEAVEDISPP